MDGENKTQAKILLFNMGHDDQGALELPIVADSDFKLLDSWGIDTWVQDESTYLYTVTITAPVFATMYVKVCLSVFMCDNNRRMHFRQKSTG